MINAKKLIKMARKWQGMAALGRRRLLPLQRRTTNVDSISNDAPFVADKGHFVIYTADKRRFMVPLEYLHNDLINMSEDEFGFSIGGPITTPCDAASMEYMISLIQRGCLAKDLEKTRLTIASSHCSLEASANQTYISRQVIVCVH